MPKKTKKAAKKAKDLPARALSAKQAKQVVGGRKAGGDPQTYLTVKMSDVIVTS